MRKAIAGTATAVVLAGGGLVACGGGSSSTAPPKAPTTAIHAPATSSSVPTLRVGDTIGVTTATDSSLGIPGGRAEVHLDKLVSRQTQQPPDLPVQHAPAGKQFVTATLTVKNVGSTEFDTYWLSAPQRWTTSDGKVSSPTLAVGGDAFTDQPNPRPGERVVGVTSVVVPNGAGTLEFQDRGTNPMFRLVVPK